MSRSGPSRIEISDVKRRVMRSFSASESAFGSTVIPPLAPPNGMLTTAHFQVIHIARAFTSSSVTPGWYRMPPLDGPARDRSAGRGGPGTRGSIAVVHLDRDRDGELALRIAENLARAGIEAEMVRGALELEPREVERIQVLGAAGRLRGAGSGADRGLGLRGHALLLLDGIVLRGRPEISRSARQVSWAEERERLRGRPGERPEASTGRCRGRGCRPRTARARGRRRCRAAAGPAASTGSRM